MVGLSVLYCWVWIGCSLFESFCLRACQGELVSLILRRDGDGCLLRHRDLTVEADRCIDKKAFYIGNGVMNIISKSRPPCCTCHRQTLTRNSGSYDLGFAYTYCLEIVS